MDRHEPLVQQALKILHGWQRHCFAHDTRQEKTRRKRIKRNDDLAPDQKEKKLDELRKFDPSAWPKKNFKRIKKDLKKKKDLAIEKEIKDIKASTAGQSSSSSKKGPSQQPAAGPSGSEPQKPSLFGTTLSKARTPAPDVGRRCTTILESAWRKSLPPTSPRRPSPSPMPTDTASAERVESGSAMVTTSDHAASPPEPTTTSALSVEAPAVPCPAALSL
ncbi:unnamed protein product [Tilletia caries]|nr:unnamed protein product [Tilletia caries]